MTNKEAIYWLKVLDECEIKCPDCMDTEKFSMGVIGAIELALSALQTGEDTAIIPEHGRKTGYCMKCHARVDDLLAYNCPTCGRQVINYGMKVGE